LEPLPTLGPTADVRSARFFDMAFAAAVYCRA
jgi:hypothetical protein